MPYSAKSIANAFIALAKKDRKHLTNMKLQKLLYFAHALYLSTRGAPLIDESPEAWQYGPVYPSVYHEFKNFGSGPIAAWATDDHTSAPSPLPDDRAMTFLESVWRTYGSQSAQELSALSHVPEGPWARVRRERPGSMSADIPNKYIQEYYGPALLRARARAAG